MSFARLFSKHIWQYTQVLLNGAILTPGQRTVAAVLRIMGSDAKKHFQNYHHARMFLASILRGGRGAIHGGRNRTRIGRIRRMSADFV